MHSLLSMAPALGQVSASSICAADCKIWPQIHPIECKLLCNVIWPCLLWRGSRAYLSQCSNLCWPCELLWPMNGDRSNITWLPRLDLKRSGSFYPHPLRIPSQEHHTEKKSRMKDHVERGPAVPARPASSRPAKCIQLREASMEEACRRGAPPTHRIRRNKKSLPQTPRFVGCFVTCVWNPPRPSSVDLFGLICKYRSAHLRIRSGGSAAAGRNRS